jgi:hypothetical protein
MDAFFEESSLSLGRRLRRQPKHPCCSAYVALQPTFLVLELLALHVLLDRINALVHQLPG